MHQRSLFAAILLLALVTNSAGNLIASVFCPTLGTSDTSCHQEVQQSSHSSHSGMTHEMHGVDSAPTQVTDPPASENASFISVDQPVDSCSHCVSSPNPPQTALALRHTDGPRTSNDVGLAELQTNTPYLVIIPSAINATEHAPPIASSPLHVRISVFRI